MLKNPSRGNVDSHSHRAPFLIENYIPAQREPRSDKAPGGALDRDPRTGARIPAVLGRKDLQTLAPNVTRGELNRTIYVEVGCGPIGKDTSVACHDR